MQITQEEQMALNRARQVGYNKYHKVVEELAEMAGRSPATWIGTYEVGGELCRKLGRVATDLIDLSRKHPCLQSSFKYKVEVTERMRDGFRFLFQRDSESFVFRVRLLADGPLLVIPNPEIDTQELADMAVQRVAEALLRIVHLKMVVSTWNEIRESCTLIERRKSLERAETAERMLAQLEDF